MFVYVRMCVYVCVLSLGNLVLLNSKQHAQWRFLRKSLGNPSARERSRTRAISAQRRKFLSDNHTTEPVRRTWTVNILSQFNNNNNNRNTSHSMSAHLMNYPESTWTCDASDECYDDFCAKVNICASTRVQINADSRTYDYLLLFLRTENAIIDNNNSLSNSFPQLFRDGGESWHFLVCVCGCLSAVRDRHTSIWIYFRIATLALNFLRCAPVRYRWHDNDINSVLFYTFGFNILHIHFTRTERERGRKERELRTRITFLMCGVRCAVRGAHFRHGRTHARTPAST